MKIVRNLLVVLGALVVLLAGGGAWMLHRADHDPRYAEVVSIEADAAYQDEALLMRAWALPVAALYRQGGFEPQANPSVCGPTTAANVARSLGIAEASPHDIPPGVGVVSVFGIIPGGVTLDQEAEILRAATGRPVDVLRDLDLETFRAHLLQSNDPSVRYAANFHRGPLWGEGHGHISPILGYLPEEDLVFVGDVNERFGPFLVAPDRLLDAMNTVDSATGMSRGLLRIPAAEAG